MSETPPTQRIASRSEQRVVAVIDDDHRVLQSLDDLLQASGYQTRLCSSAEQFLENSVLDSADLLISDIALPGISGIELLRMLREQRRLPPSILITARNESHFEDEARDLGVLRLFSKPFDSRELLATLRAALNGYP